jgi:hypothetical protein
MGPFKKELTQSSLCQQLKVAVSSHARSSQVVQNDENWNPFPFWNDYWPLKPRLDVDEVITFGSIVNPSLDLEDAGKP